MPVTSSNSAPSAAGGPNGYNTTVYPAYTTKKAAMEGAEAALGGEEAAIAEFLQRMSNSDTSSWTDKGSYLQ